MDLAGTAPLVLPAWANLLLSGLLVLALAAFHHDAPPVPRRPWLVALGIAIAVLLGLSLVVRPTTPWVLLDWPGLYCLALVGAARPTRLVRPWDERGPRAVLVAGPCPARPSRVRTPCAVTAAIPHDHAHRAALRPAGVGAAEALAVLAVGVPLARLAADTLRRLAPIPAASTASPPPTR